MSRVQLLAFVSLAAALLMIVGLNLLEGQIATSGPLGSPTPPPATPTRQWVAPHGPFLPRVEVVAANLDTPWALAFAPDSRLFVTERPGRIRLIVDGQLLSDPVATLPVAASNGAETGLMGLALDPNFRRNGYLYVMYSYRNAQEQLRNRVSRLTFDGDQAGEEMVLLDDIPGGTIHDGGRLKFGTDGTLYVTTGDTSDPGKGQDLTTLAGKVLRVNPDGSIPEDNPFPGSPIYTLGHRNPQGLAFQPGTGLLFSTEHGTGANDEVNVLEPGRNYGWPTVQGLAKDSRFADPIVAYSPTVAPSGATFYDGDLLYEWKGNLFFATLRGEHLHRVVLDGDDARRVVSEERLFEGVFGRLRDVVQSPDGYLYLATNNRDNRGGKSSPDNDRILRIVPE